MVGATYEAPLLKVEHLSVFYGDRQVVKDVGFSLRQGRCLALIGESGSGKSTIAKSVLDLLPKEARRAEGRILLKGQDLTQLPQEKLRLLRGRSLAFIPQDPQNALNPVRTIGSQAHEAARLLGVADEAAQRQRILETFELVGLADPARVYRSYPHQLSGGMLQRVLIGLSVLPKPDLIVADEPTSALDVTIQKRILEVLKDLQVALNIGVLFVTHDLALANERADDVVVLKDGAIHESGPSAQVFRAPASAYAQKLQADAPALNPDRYRVLRAQRNGVEDAPQAGIELRGVSRTFFVDGQALKAVDDVSLRMEAGRTHALVGESGSGKTTLARLVMGLEKPDEGEILLSGRNMVGLDREGLRSARRNLQLVYQNPFTSLDPTWRVGRIVREPLDQYEVGSKARRDAQVREMLHAVGLSDDVAARKPAALSGGQRQRVAIARALVLGPKVLVLDEPTSALDVSVQAGIMEMLLRLQAELGLTYLFVSHDLSLVRQIADTVSVLRHGRVVEQGTLAQVFANPVQPYTRMLLASIPGPANVEDNPCRVLSTI